MRTDDLIEALAADAGPVRGDLVERRTLLLGGLGLLAAAALFTALLDLRPDLVAALAAPVTAAKTLTPLLLAGLALPLAWRAARPGAAPSPLRRAVWLPAALFAALFAVAYAAVPAGARAGAIAGNSLAVCLPAILLLSAPILGGLLAALRAGAPTRPSLAGALAGAAAGGIGAALYSLRCTEDSPLFFALWYAAAIAAVAVIGALIGRRALRW